jgi:parvulin-like peptidyl-prolyl isomerase
MIRSVLAIILGATIIGGAQTQAPPAHPDSRSAAAATQQPAPSQPSSQSQSTASPASTPKPASAPDAEDKAASVPSAESVITIQGVCSGAAPARRTAATATTKHASTGRGAGAPCRTLVTKAQFEKLVDSLNQGNKTLAPAQRRNLAQVYVELLAFNQVATKAGIDKDPHFAEVMRFLRLRTLAEFYRRSLEEKYRTPRPADVQAYYNENVKKYEEIKLSRIFIPARNPASANKDDWDKKASQEANDIHDRAAKGEDLDKLQKEAFTTLGLTMAPPSTSMGARRRGMMAASEEQEIFDLKAGDVSKVEQEPAGYIIYKVDSRETLPVDKVKDEISRELFRQKMEEQMKSVTASVHADFNDQYFGPAAPAPAVGSRGPRPPGMAPGAGPNAPAQNQPVARPIPEAPSSTTPPASQNQAPPK